MSETEQAAKAGRRHCEFVRGSGGKDCWRYTVRRNEWCVPCLARAVEHPNEARRAAGRHTIATE